MSLSNTCGASFSNTRVTIIDAVGSGQEPNAEYHVYRLSRPLNLPDALTRQVALASADAIKGRRVLVYDAAVDSARVRKVMEVTNSDDVGLGMPLPRGRLRIYKKEDGHALHFVSEDDLAPTARNDVVRVFLAYETDLQGSHSRTEVTELSDTAYRESYTVRLTNRKRAEVPVTVVEHHHGAWSVVTSSHKYDKKETALEFPVVVPAESEVIIEYTVLFRT